MTLVVGSPACTASVDDASTSVTAMEVVPVVGSPAGVTKGTARVAGRESARRRVERAVQRMSNGSSKHN